MSKTLDIRYANRRRPKRGPMLAWMEAALEAVDPERAVRRAVEREDDRLKIGGEMLELSGGGDVLALGMGKAAGGMARGLESVLGARIEAGCVAVGAKASDAPGGALERVETIEGSHPLPEAGSLEAGRRLLALAKRADADDLVLCAVSGGGSALAEVPAGTLTLEAIRETTEQLLASGRPIDAINAVRKHLSALKGGQLARAIHPARTATLPISDVVGDRIDTIASGPTAPDATTFEEALAVLEGANLVDRVPESVVEHLRAGARGDVAETPKPGDALFDETLFEIVASRMDALEAARRAAREDGWRTRVLTTEMKGEAREVARDLVDTIDSVCRSGEPVDPPVCLLACGEATVTVTGEGTGGRNQELALAAAIELERRSWSEEIEITIGALATDGVDGPTEAAGAIVDADTVRRGEALGLDAEAHLRDNDAHPYLEATGELLETGPTGTNVNDLVVAVVGGEE